MKTTIELQTIGNRLLNIAQDQGADAAQVKAFSMRQGEIKIEKNDYHLSSSSDNAQITLTIHKNNRLGSASTNELSDDGLRNVSQRAITIASTSTVDDKLAFSKPGEILHLSLNDIAVAELGTLELSDIAKEVFQPVLSDTEISLDTGMLNRKHITQCIENSNGVSLVKESTLLSLMLMVMGIRGDQVTSFDYDSVNLRKLDNFFAEAKEMSHNLISEIKSMFNPRKGEAYRGMIILRPEVVEWILLATINFHAHGNALKDNTSLWKEKLGKKVGSPLLTLKDDPHNLDYLSASGFDQAGTPTSPSTLIDKGVLNFFMESVDSASRRDTKPTGHEFEINVPRLDGGKGGILDLSEKAGCPILCVRRFAGNVNVITGDFSGVAKNSHLVVDGEISPVIETMIAGNVFDLINNIVAVGEPKNHRHFLETGPYLVDGVTVSVGE